MSKPAPQQRAKKKSKAARRKKRHAFIDRHFTAGKLLPLYFVLVVGSFIAVKVLTKDSGNAWVGAIAMFVCVVLPLTTVWDEKRLRHYRAARRRWNKERKYYLAAGKPFTQPAPKKPIPVVDFSANASLG